MINGPPEIVGLSIDLHEDLIQVPLPLRDLSHEIRSPDADLAGEHRPKPIDPEPHALVADIDPALMEKVFDIPKRKRKPDIHHHRKLDDLGRRFEVAERIAGHQVTLAPLPYRLNRPVLLTIPNRFMDMD